MFKEDYILELISGHLTQKGYASILSSVASMVKRFNWQKDIVVSVTTSSSWTDDDIQELTQQFFEWIIVNGKLSHINKIPYDYLSYYFTQMLVSFVSNRIKEEQQKNGISFQKCKELVKEIIDESYTPVYHLEKLYVRSNLVSNDMWITDLEYAVKYLSHYPITDNTKQYKPIIKLAIEDILLSADGYVFVDSLINAVFDLLDQSMFVVNIEDSDLPNDNSNKYAKAIGVIIDGVTSIDAQIFINYIFSSDEEKMSLSEMSNKYGIPKSSVHKKIEDFKRKIFQVYKPENEGDGICFLQNLAQSLDDLTK